MKTYLWLLHVITGVMAIFTAILRNDNIANSAPIFVALSVSALLGLVIIQVTTKCNNA